MSKPMRSSLFRELIMPMISKTPEERAESVREVDRLNAATAEQERAYYASLSEQERQDYDALTEGMMPRLGKLSDRLWHDAAAASATRTRPAPSQEKLMDERLMSTADAAACADAARRIEEAIQATWECIEGPAYSHVEWRRCQGADGRSIYEAWGANGPASHDGRMLGTRDLVSLIAWIPDAIMQVAGRMLGREFETAGKNLPGVTPETHRLVWRGRPQVERRDDGRYYLSMRFAFMPKDAWILYEAS